MLVLLTLWVFTRVLLYFTKELLLEGFSYVTTAGRMARGKMILRPGASSLPITSILHPDLKQPGSYVGRQIGLPGYNP